MNYTERSILDPTPAAVELVPPNEVMIPDEERVEARSGGLLESQPVVTSMFPAMVTAVVQLFMGFQAGDQEMIIAAATSALTVGFGIWQAYRKVYSKRTYDKHMNEVAALTQHVAESNHQVEMEHALAESAATSRHTALLEVNEWLEAVAATNAQTWEGMVDAEALALVPPPLPEEN